MSRFEGRQLDRFYFLFFVWHIPISFCVDFQAIYPPAIMRLLASTPLPAFIEWYKAWSRDPIIVNAAAGGWEWDWIRGFMWVEALFQMPCWIVGAWCLWHSASFLLGRVSEADSILSDDKRVYRELPVADTIPHDCA